MSSVTATSFSVNLFPITEGYNDIPKCDVIGKTNFVSFNRGSVLFGRGLISREMQYSFSCSTVLFWILSEFHCFAVLLSFVTAVLIQKYNLRLEGMQSYHNVNQPLKTPF